VAVKALSLWQPWASAIALGHKRIETRGWSRAYRGELAIHAARTTLPGLMSVRAYSDLWRAVLGDDAARGVVAAFDRLPFGAVVAVCRLREVVPVADLMDPTGKRLGGEVGPLERQLGDYSAGRFAWVLEDVRPLRDPVPARGRQGLFELDAAIADRVKAAA
jgi:activating signal cointegrator 1